MYDNLYARRYLAQTGHVCRKVKSWIAQHNRTALQARYTGKSGVQINFSVPIIHQNPWLNGSKCIRLIARKHWVPLSYILSIGQPSEHIPIEPWRGTLTSLMEVNRELQPLYGKTILIFATAMLLGARSSPRILKMCQQMFL